MLPPVSKQPPPGPYVHVTPGPGGPHRLRPTRIVRAAFAVATFTITFGLIGCLTVYYFITTGGETEEPVYPQQYEPSVAAVPPGGSYGDIDDVAAGRLCDDGYRSRVGLVLPVTDTEHRYADGDDPIAYECTLSLSNLDAYPTTGTKGEFKVSLYTFADPADAKRDHEAALTMWSGTPEVAVNGMEIDATAFPTYGGGVALTATDGNLGVSISFTFEVVDGGEFLEQPDVPVNVLVGICVDTANELIPLAAEDE